MSSESNSRPQDGQRYSATEDLENKLMEVGSHNYRIDMKQNGDSRFFSVTDSSTQRPNRIVVPMSFCGEFCSKIYEIIKFSQSYIPKNVSTKKNPMDRIVFAQSINFTTPGGRRYYLDVLDQEDTLTLRMSYVFGDRRDNIHMIVDCLVNFVEILEGFARKYPSISPNDDYRLRRRMDGSRPSTRGGRYPRRYYDGAKRGGRPFVPSNFEGNRNPRQSSLRVCNDPAPEQVVNNLKKYKFEIVEGTNTFMRITEIVGENKKSTIHVPIDCLARIQTVLGDMGKRFSVTKSNASVTKS